MINSNNSTTAHFNIDATQFTLVLYTINATAYSSTDIYNYFLILDFHPPLLPWHNSLEQSTSWKADGSSRTFQHFMEPDGSLPCAQKPDTSANPEPNQSTPHSSHPISWRSISLLSSHLCLALRSVHPDIKERNYLGCLQFSFSNRMADNAGNMSEQRSARSEGPSPRQPCTSVNMPRGQTFFTLSYLASALQWFLPVVRRLLIWSCACQNVLWPMGVFSPSIRRLQKNVW